jgi:electron transfer flavoprotein beta subunit
VAVALDRPVVNGIKGLEIGEGSVTARREANGGGWDLYELPLPAVVGVKEGINLPRYPSVPGRMRARSKPVAVLAPQPPEPHLELVRLAVPAGQGRRAESLGSGAAAAPGVVDVLEKAGLL